MYLKKIKTSNYRNLKNLELELNEKVNIFIGENGQGKTNLLEAIYFLSISKSFKTNKLNEITNFEQQDFYINAFFYKKDFLYNVETEFLKNKKKVLINKSESKFKDFIGLLNVIIFVPEDLDLLKGNPKVRRKLLDIELSKLSSLYLLNLSHYYHLLKQRNNYLKMKKIDEIVIKTLNQQLAFYGEQIFTERNKFIDELSLLVEKFYQIISETDDKIKIEYQSNIYKDKLTFLDNLEKSYQRDLLLQQTNVGVHRDDFIVYLNEKNASNYASQGELRSIVLAFKLALVEYIYLKIKEYPLLLLDDVMSELDTKRQQNLIKYLNKKVQTFITTTSIDNLENEIVDGASLFYIDDGNVREEII